MLSLSLPFSNIKPNIHCIGSLRHTWDNLLETVSRQGNEITFLKAKLPMVQDVEEDHGKGTLEVNSTRSEHHVYENQKENMDTQEDCQTKSYDDEIMVHETIENEKRDPIVISVKSKIAEDQLRCKEVLDKNFKCDRCPYKTNLKGNLVRHVSRHNTHICDHCSFTATSKSKLKDHMKEAHDGSRNLHLECNLKFNRHEKFKYHTEKVPQKSNNYVQEESETAGKFVTYLSHHMDYTKKREDNVTFNQWGDKTFQCDHCPLTYIYKGQLLRHIKKCHEEGQNPKF